KVPTAVDGSTLAGGFKITHRKMRGVESQGMMCAPDELGMGSDHSGLLILPADAPVGADALHLLGLDDTVLEIEITPNRGDWASMIGVARELSALHKTPLRQPQFKLQEDGPPASGYSSVTIEAPELCPRYAGRIITGLTIGPSPLWLRQRLLAAGQRPINNVVDVTNLVLLETCQALHAFDFNKLHENRIVVRNAKHNETIETLDEQTRKLTPEMLVIADARHPVALAGIMGGAASEVTDSTTDIFLESAYFQPATVRATARALGMNTEASQRFQRGADPEMAIWALDRAAYLIQLVAGGAIAKGRLDEYPKPFETKTLQLRYARTDLLLGTAVPPEEQRGILERLAFTSTATDETTCTVRIPSWRHDVGREADLIEEIARVYGYEKIAASLPPVRQNELIFAPQERPLRNLRNYLTSNGLTEVMCMTFSNPRELENAGLAEDVRCQVSLQNPLSENSTGLRTSLIPGLLSTIGSNLRKGSTDLALFETGPVYNLVEGKALPNEFLRCVIALTGAPGGKHWSAPLQKADFYDLKGYFEALMHHLGVSWELVPFESPTYHPRASAQILVNGKIAGMMGETRPKVLRSFDIHQPVYLLDLDLATLFSVTVQPARFSEPPAFPPSLRDLAIIVDKSVAAAELLQTARTAGGRLLSKVSIFDLYTGKQVPEGKKSVALSLVFQAADRTLTDADTEKRYEKIIAELRKTCGAELR
ncbi:MAG TPA: phenylalanine--tRNA ligase subunit beta, partial [Candidatus Hydrogenedentes bacterium]|nr:phenylalanine--tRNA ligase subunit beta [Candidatus Hydrogenedentota bacterium]